MARVAAWSKLSPEEYLAWERAQERSTSTSTARCSRWPTATEQYDRGLKWDGYQLLPSLTDYILVSQDRAHVEHFGRLDKRWTYASTGGGGVVTLTNRLVLDVDGVAGVLDLPGE